MNVKENFETKKEQEFAVDYLKIKRVPQIFFDGRFLSEKPRDCKMVI